MLRGVIAALVVSIIIGLPASSAAQSERGTISGVVSDSSKARLPGVTLQITNTATNQATTVVSSEAGAYSASNLPPGTYRVEATLSGFRPVTITNIQLSTGGGARQDITMDIGALSESVNVVATASLLQTQDARVSSVVSNQLIDQLPLVVGGAMRSVFDLVSTVPEAKGSGQTASLGGGQGGGYSASLDGIVITTSRAANTTQDAFLTPSVEAITEFAVETNGFKPEFGQAAGGAITFASKSGTNKFQGSVYEFLRDESLDSKDYFAKQKGVYNQHNYGASWGGPVKLPGYNGTDKTFFFATYEGFINEVNTAANLLSVPTPEMWNGDFSNLVDRNGNKLIIYDPATTRPNPNGTGYIRDPFPNNQIPLNRFSALAKNYVALARTAVVPNQPATPGTFAYINRNFLAASGTQKETTRKFSIKLDHALSSHQRLSYLYNRTLDLTMPGASGPVGLPVPFDGASRTRFDTSAHRVSWDWTGSRMVNHLSFGQNTFVADGYTANLGGNWKEKGICLLNAIDCNKNFGQINFSGEFQNWGAIAENGTEQPSRTLKNDFSLTASSHTIKMGVTYAVQESTGIGQQSIAGSSTFDYRSTSVPGISTQTSGSAMASFLLGYAFSGGTEQIRRVQQVYPYVALYAQDDWRLGDKVVLNYGLRYEFTLPAHEGTDKYTDFDPTRPNPKVNNYPGALKFAGSGPGRENRRSLIDGYYGAIAPRLSLAYQANDKTTVRAGVGRSFGRVQVPGGSSHYDGHIGNWTWTSPDLGVTPAFLLDQGLPRYDLPPFLDPSIDNNLATDWWGGGNTASRPGYYDSWTLSMQRDLHRGLTAEVDYNGSYGKNLPTGLITANQVPMSKIDALLARPDLDERNIQAFLNTTINSAAQAAQLGIPLPYPQFVDPSIQTLRTVAQALRPFPQYGNINLSNGGGDKSGKSHYHAVLLKLNQRLRNGLTIQSSYTWSRIMTDSDRTGNGSSLDTARPELEWSIGGLDQTHNIKINTVYELPFGRDRRWLKTGVANLVLGGWRAALSQTYVSGVPLIVTTSSTLQIFNTANRPNVTGQPWRAEPKGDKFDPAVDLVYNKAAFSQPVGTLGNAPRTNPDMRRDWTPNENISLAKTFDIGGSRRFDLRFEAFNMFNRVVWGAPNSNFSNTAFGQVTSTGAPPRQMQIGLKLYW